MKHKIKIIHVWETMNKANPQSPVKLTGLSFSLVEHGEQHSIFIPGHNLKHSDVKKAIKDFLRTLPQRPVLEGTILEVDTEEEES